MQKIEIGRNPEQILKEKLLQFVAKEKNFLANACNFAALVFHNLEGVNWSGFYFLCGEELILGPYQGKAACVRININTGVCGSAVRTKKAIIVDDVHKFPGYIPCDPTANSEMVVPVSYDGKIIGVFDLDSPNFKRFSIREADLIESLLKILISNSDVQKFLSYYD